MKKKALSSNVEWKAWGERDPLWAVASWKGRESGGRQEWTEDEFFGLGESDWKDFVARWDRYGRDRSHCVEIGCGVGRLTAPMSRWFGGMDAIDVSSDMVEYARRRLGNSYVTFHVGDGRTIPLAEGCAGAVFSAHVFQHLDSLTDAEGAFSEVSRILSPGGTLMIHVPFYEWPAGGRVFEAAYRVLKIGGGMRAALNRLLIRCGMFRPVMRGLHFPVPWIFETLSRLALEDIELITFPVRSNGALHSFVFGRRKP